MGARETALNALIACRKDGAWSNGVLKSYVQRDRLDRRDAALAARLCYGVLQNRLLLDYWLQQLLTGKLKSLHPVVHDILHLGLYQICFLDKIPDSAVVNESVSLSKKYCSRQNNAPGLVNAVLRAAIRTGDSLQQPKSYVEKYSHPQVLVDLLKSYVGKEKLEPMLRANNEIVPTVIQVNTLRTDAEALQKMLEDEGVTARTHDWMPDCLVLSGTGDLERLQSFRDGLFYVQDCAAKLSVLCAQLPENANVLDCCAAPGGKSFAAYIAMSGTGSITSCDIYPHKAELIESGARRLGFANITAKVHDASVFEPQWEQAMDAVIADVPCSGYGIIRKKPDIRYKDPASMEDLPDLQKKILATQARYVKPGGVLLYSTCTLLYRENEAVVEAFLQDHPDFALELLPLPGVFPKNTTGMLALIPGEYDTDGFFISRLRRKV
ncbi:MAG: 16S rRNA (cytosine(967)-C(5))-methyltransferase RsmB [Oscillospiraceae bacterium]|nr:16S rRNA (cytosine(967)-C(5))-methyltransferase RsmB [Oscillospiraceae bacterium]